jgi:hypothetical protein
MYPVNISPILVDWQQPTKFYKSNSSITCKVRSGLSGSVFTFYEVILVSIFTNFSSPNVELHSCQGANIFFYIVEVSLTKLCACSYCQAVISTKDANILLKGLHFMFCISSKHFHSDVISFCFFIISWVKMHLFIEQRKNAQIKKKFQI